MASITIRNIPEGLLAKIKERAKNERRSLNNEVIKRLEESESVKSIHLSTFYEENSFDDDYIRGVEEAMASRSYGRDDKSK